MKLKFAIIFCTILMLFSISRIISKNNSKTKDNKEIPTDWFYQQRAYPYDQINYDAYNMALTQVRQFKNGLRSGIPTKSWKLVGPSNIGGRITDIEMHPSDQKTIYAGTATGGIFKSIDFGINWKPIFDQESSLSIGDIAISATNPNLLFAGTGEANAGGGSTTYDGTGVFKSTNGGNSWTFSGLEKIKNTGRVIIDPKNDQTIYVAGMGDLYGNSSDRGIFKSTDGGSNWQKVLYVNDSTGGIDLVINPQNTNILYAAMWERVRRINRRTYGGISCNIYKSTNAGQTWLKQGNGLPVSNSNSGRIGLSIAESNPNILYAIYSDKTGYFDGIYKTTNDGNSWARVNDQSLSNMFASYGWWFGRIKIDPTNPNKVYAIGYELHKSTDGGNSWNDIGANIHVDHHSIYPHPLNSKSIVLGSDGGVFTSKDEGNSWTHSNNLPITQFYTCEIDNNNPKNYYGGAQDNNVLRTLSNDLNSWKDILGGDGLVVLVDPNNSKNIYAEWQYGELSKSTNGGLSFNYSTDGISSSDRKNWNTPVVFDPTDTKVLYYGTNRLYKSLDQADNWSVISPDLTNGNGGNNLGTISCIAVSYSNNKVIYAGTDDGNVWNTLDAGMNWKKISSTLPNRWVTRIAVDKTNAAIAYVTLSGFRKNEYLSHIFRTENYGSSWQDISYNLPEAPLNDILIDPMDNSTLYVASDVGVFKGSNKGNWTILGDSLPFVPVNDLTLHSASRQLLAATFGRSMYTYDLGLSTSTNQLDKTEKFIDFTVLNNPVFSELKLILNFSNQEFGKIQLYNMNGELQYNLFLGSFNSGIQQMNFNISNIQEIKSGIYYCVLITNKNKFSKKILILK
ncbi:MAG: T9SS type A sorting domain-containing protein [Saprospiraceae bacterium]